MAKKMSEEKRVAVFVPKMGKDSANVYVSVNGSSALLPRGKTSYVKPEIAKEYYRMYKAEERYDETVDRLKTKDEK